MTDIIRDIEKYRDLRFDPHFPFEKTEGYRDEIKKEISLKKLKYESLKKIIEGVPPELTNKFKDSVIMSINNCIEAINGNVQNLPLSKNQGTIIEGRVYARFIEFISYALTGPTFWSSLYYSDDPIDQLDSKKIEPLLRKSKEEIQAQNFDTYFELEQKVESLIEKIKNLWKQDIKRN